MKKTNLKLAGSSESHEPRRLSEVLNEYFAGNSPLARAYRDRLFEDIFPHTEPCCELKLLTRQPGCMLVGAMLEGVLVHNDDDNYVFAEKVTEDNVVERKTTRNAFLYEGTCVNVKMRDDGVVFPTFRYGLLFSKNIDFRDFCFSAARELISLGEAL